MSVSRPRRHLSEILPSIIWRATYEDGTKVWERDPKTGKELRIIDLDLDRIRGFDLIPTSNTQEDFEAGASDIQVGTDDNAPAILTFKFYHKEIQPIFHMDISEGKKIIFARRSMYSTGRKVAHIPMNMKDPKDPKKTVTNTFKIPFPDPRSGTRKIIIVGYQWNVKGKNRQSIVFIHPDGKIELTDGWREDAHHGPIELKAQKEAPKTGVAVDANVIEAEIVTDQGK